jgi:hypothetical protein
MYVHKYIICIHVHIVFYLDFLSVHTINTSVVDPTQGELDISSKRNIQSL